MRFRFTLQWKVLLLTTTTMLGLVAASAYLHGAITRALLDENGYDAAVGKTVGLAERIAAHDYFHNTEALQRDVDLVRFGTDDAQLDVYAVAPSGPTLVATSAPDARRLPPLDGASADNELGEMDRPLPDVVTMETEREGLRYWLISVSVRGGATAGFVSALVRKDATNAFVSRLEYEHDAVLVGTVAATAALLYYLFAVFFRRPTREVVAALARAREGDREVRVSEQRGDELGDVARGFNRMMDDMSERAAERDALLGRISGFNEELRANVAEATAELRAVNEALLGAQRRLARLERLAALGHVAAAFAHEIGTPLNAISGHLKLLARHHPADPDVQRRVGIVESQITYIVGIVRSMLERTHRRRVRCTTTDLNALVADLVSLVVPTLDAHDIAVEVDLDPARPLVFADRESMQQVLLSLINNSLDAMPEAGVVVLTTRENAAEGVAELYVADSGTGIELDALDQLFEPLWTSKATGSGFGLAVAREVMTEHNGRIDLVSDGSPGACFRLSLPLADRDGALRNSAEV